MPILSLNRVRLPQGFGAVWMLSDGREHYCSKRKLVELSSTVQNKEEYFLITMFSFLHFMQKQTPFFMQKQTPCLLTASRAWRCSWPLIVTLVSQCAGKDKRHCTDTVLLLEWFWRVQQAPDCVNDTDSCYIPTPREVMKVAG